MVEGTDEQALFSTMDLGLKTNNGQPALRLPEFTGHVSVFPKCRRMESPQQFDI